MVFGRIAGVLCAVASAAWAQTGFYLHDGDRVVFYGDSITDQRLYTTDTETFAVTRFPKERFTFIHSGWGGDRVSGGGGGPIDARLERDVFAYKPSVVTIMLGMNDAGYRSFDPALFETYSAGYRHIVDSIKKHFPNARLTLIQPSPFDDVAQAPKFEGGYNSVLLRYADFVKQLAAEDHLDTADLNRPLVEDLKRAVAIDPSAAKKLIPDRIHPGPAGHLLMAEALLKAWHAPAVVSDVEIDLANRRVVHADQATVTGVSANGWNELDRALPMPIDWNDPQVRLAMEASDFVDTLDREMLRVTGLPKGQWTLKIDGVEAGDFSSDDLSHGVNLAKHDTPMMRQAIKVHEYTHKHADLHNTRWRNIQVPLSGDHLPGLDQLMSTMDRVELDLVNEQRKAAQPVPHTFELAAKS